MKSMAACVAGKRSEAAGGAVPTRGTSEQSMAARGMGEQSGAAHGTGFNGA